MSYLEEGYTAGLDPGVDTFCDTLQQQCTHSENVNSMFLQLNLKNISADWTPGQRHVL